MYFVYILYSSSNKIFYKGQTSNLIDRLHRHNAGYESYTSKGKPWQLVWYGCKDTRAEAIKLEKNLKNLSVKRVVQFVEKFPSDSVTGLDVCDLPDL